MIVKVLYIPSIFSLVNEMKTHYVYNIMIPSMQVVMNGHTNVFVTNLGFIEFPPSKTIRISSNKL